MCGVRVRTLVRLGWAFFANPNARITVRVRVGRECMVSEMVEIFFSQYLANFETRRCGGDFSPQNLRATLRFRDICKRRLNSFRNAVLATRRVQKSTYFIDDGDMIRILVL
jgi:hypothetical protein